MKPIPRKPAFENLLAWIEARLRRLAKPGGVCLLAVVAAAIVWLMQRRSAGFLYEGGPDAFSLQLAFDAGTLRQILTLWADRSAADAMHAVRASLAIDLVFPFVYAALISATYWWFLNTADVRRPAPGQRRIIKPVWPPRIGLFLPWIAAAADLVENGLLFMLVPASDAVLPSATFAPWLVWTASCVSAFKWTCVVVALMLCVHAFLNGPRGAVLRLARYSVISILLGSVPLAFSDQGLDVVTSLAESPGWWTLLRWWIALWVWATAVWYCSRLLLDAGRDTAPGWTFDVWATWLPRVLGALTLAMPAVAFTRAAERVYSVPQGSAPRTMAWTCVISAAAFLVIVIVRRQLIARWTRRRTNGFSLSRVAPGSKVVTLAALVLSATLFVLLTGWPVPIGAWLGAPSILVIAAANTVFFGSLAVFAGRVWKLPLDVMALCAAVAFSFWNDNHDVRSLPDGGATIARRLPVADAYAQWSARHPDGPVVLVAAEGGGIRAAYWTAAILSDLGEKIPELRTRTFAVSGISGGSVGAAVYAALIRDGRPHLAADARHVFADGFLAPVLAKMVTGDFLQWLLPVPVRPFDRSAGLEGAMIAAYSSAGRPSTFAAPFLALAPDVTAGVPALFLSSVSVETGARVIASPFAWPAAPPRRDRVDLFDLTGRDLTLAAAVHNSARFTYVSPAGRLRGPSGEDRGHVVDGGYFENTGIETTIDLIEAAAINGTRPIVVLVLCNTPGGCSSPVIAAVDEPQQDDARLQPATQVTSWMSRQSLGELLSPVRALLATRDMRGHLARARLAEIATVIEFGDCRPPDVRARQASAPLGWQLSMGARIGLDALVSACEPAPMGVLRRALSGQRPGS